MARHRRSVSDANVLSSTDKGENMRTIESFIAKPNLLDQHSKNLAAQDFQTTIVGMLGHDLRQSLHVIMGTYALLRTRSEQTPQQALLYRGERAATKLTEQLNCMVDAFYLAERANRLEISPVGLGPLF